MAVVVLLYGLYRWNEVDNWYRNQLIQFNGMPSVLTKLAVIEIEAKEMESKILAGSDRDKTAKAQEVRIQAQEKSKDILIHLQLELKERKKKLEKRRTELLWKFWTSLED